MSFPSLLQRLIPGSARSGVGRTRCCNSPRPGRPVNQLSLPLVTLNPDQASTVIKRNAFLRGRQELAARDLVFADPFLEDCRC